MSDTNPYASPAVDAFVASYKDEGADIETLAVAKRWKRRFHLIKGAGGIDNASFGARRFNVLALLFGSIYYLLKGMWRKAITLFCVTSSIYVACNIALLLLHMPDNLGYAASLVIATIYGFRANGDYYRKMVLGENGWW